MYFNLFKSLEKDTPSKTKENFSIQTILFVQGHFHFFPSCNRADSSTIDRLARIRLKQSIDNYNFFTHCSSIVDLESVREVWTTTKERSDGKMIMKDGAMLDTFPSIPLLILPLILFQLYSTFQLRLLSVAHYLSHFWTFTLTIWNGQRPTVYLYS